MASEATETVAQAIVEPSVRLELIQNLEAFLYGHLYLALWGTPVEIGQPTITSLMCLQCAMTYPACLTLGLGVEFCKRRYLTCPTVPISALSIAVPLTAPIRGTVTFEASASYRELNDPDDPLPYEWCVTIHATIQLALTSRTHWPATISIHTCPPMASSVSTRGIGTTEERQDGLQSMPSSVVAERRGGVYSPRMVDCRQVRGCPLLRRRSAHSTQA
jgi:hypothetical protein